MVMATYFSQEVVYALYQKDNPTSWPKTFKIQTCISSALILTISKYPIFPVE